MKEHEYAIVMNVIQLTMRINCIFMLFYNVYQTSKSKFLPCVFSPDLHCLHMSEICIQKSERHNFDINMSLPIGDPLGKASVSPIIVEQDTVKGHNIKTTGQTLCWSFL